MTVEARRAPTILILMTILLAIVSRVWVSFPTWMHYDENYYINIAQNYVTRGQLTPYMWRLGEVNIISGSGSGYGILLLIEWLRLVDFSLFWGRMLMVMVGLLTAGVMYQVAKLWWYSRVAGLAAFVFALVGTSPFYTLILKMDAIGILMYSLVLLLHLYAVRLNNRWLHLGTGILAVVTLEFHVLGMLYALALSAYYAWRYVVDVVEKRRIVLAHEAVYFASGVLLAGGIYALVHILPDPKEYFYVATHCLECDEGLLLTEFKRMIRMFVLRPTDVLIFFFVFASAVVRHKQEDNHYLAIVLGWLVAQAIVGPPPYAHYISHFWPLVALGAAGFVAWGFRYRPNHWRLPICAALATVLVFANLGMHLAGSHPFLLSYELKPCTPTGTAATEGETAPVCERILGQSTGNKDAVAYIQAAVPRKTVIMAGVPLFYPLRDYESFLAYRDGSIYGADLRGESMLEFWHRIEPQVVLLDEDIVLRDSELTQYLRERQFVHVLPGLWVSEDLWVSQPPGINGDRLPTLQIWSSWKWMRC